TPFEVGAPLPTIADPFISHSESEPSALRQRTSAMLSPSKSPTPATLQDRSGLTATPLDVSDALAVIFVPFTVHSEVAPLLLRQRMSAAPSPLKSPIPATLHVGSGLTAAPRDNRDELDEIAEP